jgi:hypothetical protein
VLKLRFRHGIKLSLAQVRQGNLAEGYSIRELSELLNVDSSGFYGCITKGKIQIEKHPRYGCYLFPRTEETVHQLKRLRSGKLAQLSFPKEHPNG